MIKYQTISILNSGFLNIDPSMGDETSIEILDAPKFTMECPELLAVGNLTECTMTDTVQGYNQTFAVSISSSFQSYTATGRIPGEFQLGFQP